MILQVWVCVLTWKPWAGASYALYSLPSSPPVLVWIIRRNTTNKVHTHTHTQIYYKEFAHVVLKIDRSQDLQLVRWKLRRADGKDPYWKLTDLRLRKNQCFSLNLKAGEKTMFQFQGSQAAGVPSYSDFLFYSDLHHPR